MSNQDDKVKQTFCGKGSNQARIYQMAELYGLGDLAGTFKTVKKWSPYLPKEGTKAYKCKLWAKTPKGWTLKTYCLFHDGQIDYQGNRERDLKGYYDEIAPAWAL